MQGSSCTIMNAGEALNQLPIGLSQLHKMHRRRVHAVAQSRWLRAVIKDVSQMSVTQPAGNSCALHAQASIGNFNHILLGDRRPEAGPPGTRLDLGIGTEYRRVAADAAEETAVMQIPCSACIGALRARLASYLVGNWG